MQNNYKKPYKKNFNKVLRELSPEEKFEKMMADFLKNSKEKFNDMTKSKDKKRRKRKNINQNEPE